MAILTAPQVLGFALAAGFTRSEANMFTVIAHYESGWDTNNIGDQTLSRYGSIGLEQPFTGVHDPEELGVGTGSWTPALIVKLKDPLTNMKAARIIYKEQGYSAWSTYNNYHNTSGFISLLAKVSSMTPVMPNSGGSVSVSVSLTRLIKAAQVDPPAAQGVASDPTMVQPVQNALVSETLLDKQWATGAYGTKTVSAYIKWQQSLGYSGNDADGIPGLASLTALGNKYSFSVGTDDVGAVPVTKLPDKSDVDYLRLLGNINAYAIAGVANARLQLAHIKLPSGISSWHNECELFVRTMFGAPGGAPTAIAAFNAVPEAKQHSFYNPPFGVPVFWSGGTDGDGHVALALGDGTIISTDIGGSGTVSVVPISKIVSSWGLVLKGWTEEINGFTVYTPGKAA